MIAGGSYNILRCYYILNALVLNGRITSGFFVPHIASSKKPGLVDRLHSNYHRRFYYYNEDDDLSSGLGYCYTNAHTSALFMGPRGVSGDHWTQGSNTRETVFQQEMGQDDAYSSGMSSGSYNAGSRSDYSNYNSGYSRFDRDGSIGSGYGYPSSNRQYDLDYGSSRIGGGYSDDYYNGGSGGDYYSRRGDDGFRFGRSLFSRNQYRDRDSRGYGSGGGREFYNRGHGEDRYYNNYNMDDRRYYGGGMDYFGEGGMYGRDMSRRRGRRGRGRGRFFGSWFDNGMGGREDDYFMDEGGMGGYYPRRSPSTKRMAFTALSCYLINDVIGTVPMFVYLLISNAVNTKSYYERLRSGGRMPVKRIMTRLLIGNVISCTYAAWGWFLASRQAYMPPLARGRWKTFTVLYWIFFYITGKVRRSKVSRYRIADALEDRMSWRQSRQASKLITMTLAGIAMVTGVYLAGLLTGIPIRGTRTSGIWPQAISFIATLFLFR